MHTRTLALALSLVTLASAAALAPLASAKVVTVACTVTDTSNPHVYNLALAAGASTNGGSLANVVAYDAFSANNPPCDSIGSDGDEEQGVSGAEMPISGATCPYETDIENEQVGGGPVTVGHHGDDIFVTNTAGIDVTWSSGVDGQDPAATLSGQTCTGNGVITNDPVGDPADCLDTSGFNLNILSILQDDTDPLGIGTNDPASGYTCLDAVDGQEITFLHAGPFVGTNPPQGTLVIIDPSNAACVDPNYTGGDEEDAGCILGINPGYVPPTPTGIAGFSLPISGTITSGVEIN
jgi:hypothetical protein